MSSLELIAALCLFGPGTAAAPLLAYRILRVRRETALKAAVLAELRTDHTNGDTRPVGRASIPAPRKRTSS